MVRFRKASPNSFVAELGQTGSYTLAQFWGGIGACVVFVLIVLTIFAWYWRGLRGQKQRDRFRRSLHEAEEATQRVTTGFPRQDLRPRPSQVSREDRNHELRNIRSVIQTVRSNDVVNRESTVTTTPPTSFDQVRVQHSRKDSPNSNSPPRTNRHQDARLGNPTHNRPERTSSDSQLRAEMIARLEAVGRSSSRNPYPVNHSSNKHQRPEVSQPRQPHPPIPSYAPSFVHSHQSPTLAQQRRLTAMTATTDNSASDFSRAGDRANPTFMSKYEQLRARGMTPSEIILESDAGGTQVETEYTGTSVISGEGDSGYDNGIGGGNYLRPPEPLRVRKESGAGRIDGRPIQGK